MSRKPSPSAQPLPQPNPFRLRQGPLALAYVYGRTELPLFVSPVLYSEAIALWLAPPQDHERFLAWSSVPRRAAYRREAYELGAVFHTSAFLRNGDDLTRFRQALGLNQYSPTDPEASHRDRASLLRKVLQAFQEYRETLGLRRTMFLNRGHLLSVSSPSAFF